MKGAGLEKIVARLATRIAREKAHEFKEFNEALTEVMNPFLETLAKCYTASESSLLLKLSKAW